jgi:hypothetical protein
MEPRRLLGSQPVRLPDFADREDLARAFIESEKGGHRSIMRVYSAYLGLCTPLGKAARADFIKHRCDVLAYGGAVYGYLRGEGVTAAQIASEALPLVGHVFEHLAPREQEVAAQEDFTAPGAVQ